MGQNDGLGYFFATFVADRCRKKRGEGSQALQSEERREMGKTAWVNVLQPLTDVEKKKGRIPRRSPSLPIVRQT